jgi:hypothetical protein
MNITLAYTAATWRRLLPILKEFTPSAPGCVTERVQAAVEPFPNHQAVPVALTVSEWRTVQRARHLARHQP